MKNLMNRKFQVLGKRSLRLCAIALVAVIGFSMVACKDADETDPALNGTWVGSGVEIKFDNGSFEMTQTGMAMKGTYTTSGSTITMTITDVQYGGQWLSLGDIRPILKATGYSDADIDEMFGSTSGTYSVSGNTLTFTDEDGSKQTFTKK